MPRRADLKKIVILGAGPIVIGQACEFDYSGPQGAKALREEGYEVVLVNSNPATIMTDPEMADRTYVEPLEPKTVAVFYAEVVEAIASLGLAIPIWPVWLWAGLFVAAAASAPALYAPAGFGRDAVGAHPCGRALGRAEGRDTKE